MRVSVVGAGYVGIASALSWAACGHAVRVLDIDPERVRSLAAGVDPLGEPHVGALLAEMQVDFMTDPGRALERADVVALSVGTPMTPHGAADLSYLHAASETVASHARGAHVLVRSTVPVGTADKLQRGALRENEVVSNPEFLREGHAIKDSLQPDRIVAGGSPRARAAVEDLYGPIVTQTFRTRADIGPRDGPRPLFWMDRRSAELTKYAANAFLATKLSFVNEIANVAAHVDADIRAVTGALAADPRIGASYLRPGIGWGGSCFPKDTRALAVFAADSGYDLIVLRAAIEQNNLQLQRFFHLIGAEFRGREGVRIGLLGLAFKGGTSDCRESPAVALAELMVAEGWHVRAHDPGVRVAAPPIPAEVEVVGTALEAARGADALVVATEWPEFASADLAALAAAMRGDLLFDGRCIMNPDATTAARLRYRGICPPAEGLGD